jgi:pentatricopeptide repeat protein
MPLDPGEKLGPYEILASIGAGGMGEVYRARDSRLNREVAIKVSAREFSARFGQEAHAIASLNHPHICQIYDVGPDYLVLEYVEGKPIAGPMRVDEAVKLALQIAGAIEEAHGRGILHRDLKPANILVTGKGVAKLLDFGLAKRMADSDPDATKTMAGTVLGTMAYMAPEQAEGKALDERSDVFSFGAVLYEMLSGQRAFCGDSAAQVMSAVLRDEPRPLDSSGEVQRIVAKCMAKRASDRYGSMALVRRELEALGNGTPRASETASIAVLPFANLSADKENEYFSDGLAEEILNALSQVEGLSVAARTSAFSFKGKNAELGEIAAKLKVAHVLEGSVRRAGNRVRVSVQLVDARNGFQLWSERYDRQMEDIFEVQDEIARAIADQLKVTLGAGVKQSTKNLEAYELYLKGRHLLNQRLASTVRLAMKSFEQAIELDPGFALAYAGITDCYCILRVYGWVSAAEGKPPALAAVTKATALAPSLCEVNVSRGFYAFYYVPNWRESEAHFQKALTINPRSSIAHGYYGLFLAMDRRPQDAVKHSTLACQLDPLAPYFHGLAACTYNVLGRYELGVRYAQLALDLQPDFLFGLWTLGLSQCSLGLHQQAIETLERVISISRAPIFMGLMGAAYARAGRPEEAIRLLHELEERGLRGEYVPVNTMLPIHASLGDIPAMRRGLARTLADSTPAFSLSLVGGFLLHEFRTDPEIDRMFVELYGY